MRKRAGFSLIELLMVIAIIGIIATIAIPLLLATRRDALDEKARQSVRVVMSAQAAYHTQYGQFGTFNNLSIGSAPFLDARFVDGGADLGNSLMVMLDVAPGGQGFTVMTSNPGGTHNYEGDETFMIQQF